MAKVTKREDIEYVESVFWKRWKEADHGFFLANFVIGKRRISKLMEVFPHGFVARQRNTPFSWSLINFGERDEGVCDMRKGSRREASRDIYTLADRDAQS
jgi:hypothetical protein